MKTVLLCAFDAFGKETINPSWLAVSSLQKTGINLVKLELPTVFNRAAEIAIAKIKEISPDLIIMTGLAGGSSVIALERVAINIADATMEDNAGNCPIDEVIAENGPTAYFSTLPIKKIVACLKENSIPATISNSAGTFVCNQLMYCVLNYLSIRGKTIPAGFVHLPYLKDDALIPARPGMILSDMVRTLEVMIDCCLSSIDN